MKAVNTIQDTLLDSLDDVPPAPPRYTQYIERTFQDRIQAAYELGVDRGSKRRLGVLLLGLILGWIAGVSFASMR